MFNNIREYLNLPSLEEKISKALTLEIEISKNKKDAKELHDFFAPELVKLHKQIEAVDKLCDISKSEREVIEGLILKDRINDKLVAAKKEYFTKIGEITKSNQEDERSLKKLMSKDSVNNAVTEYKKREKFVKSFNDLKDSFDSNVLPVELFSKAIVNYQYELGDDFDDPNDEDFKTVRKALEDNIIKAELFNKAKKTAQQKKIEKVLGEFKSGSLKSGSGKTVTNRDQAIAIALSEAGLSKAEGTLQPTDAQKSAGNYKKEKKNVRGLVVSIENPKGSTRSGKDKDGKEWKVTMNNDYGYFNRTTGKDGDHIDVFLSDDPEKGNIYVVDQSNKDDKFDEHKVMIGFKSKEDALKNYKANYEQKFDIKYSGITEVSEKDLKKWLGVDKGGKEKKRKPYSELKKSQKNSFGTDHLKEIIVEHERLIKVLKSVTDPNDDIKKELAIQEKELEKYKKQLLSDNNVKKSEDDDIYVLVDDLGNETITDLDIIKGNGHKYLRREGTSGNYKYIYSESEEKTKGELTKKEKDKNFKEWFGDSKVVDKKGNPLVVYHGTNSDFSEFKDKELAKNSGNYGHMGYGFYFSDDPKEAKTYGNSIMPVHLKVEKPFINTPENLEKYASKFGYEKKEVGVDKDWFLNTLKKKDPVSYDLAKGILDKGYGEGWKDFLKKHKVDDAKFDLNDIGDLTEHVDPENKDELSDNVLDEFKDILGEKPKTIKDYEDTDQPSLVYMTGLGDYSKAKEFSDMLKKDGYDGIVSGSELVVFEPNKIKSSIGNKGTFDPKSKNITKSEDNDLHVYVDLFGYETIGNPDIIKAMGHKYIRREGTPGKWKYIYEETDDKGKKQEIETPVGEEVSMSVKGLIIKQYSKKAIAITGDTYANKDLMRSIKDKIGVGSWNRTIKAWFFPSKFKTEILGEIYSDVKNSGDDEKAAAIQNQKNEMDPGTKVNVKGIEGEIKEGASDSDGTKYNIKTKDGTELTGVDEKVLKVEPQKDDKELRKDINDASPAGRIKSEKEIYGVKPIENIHQYSLQEYLGMHGLSKDDIDKVIQSITKPKKKEDGKKPTTGTGGTKKKYTKPGQIENLTKKQLIAKLVYAHYQAVKKAVESGEKVSSDVLSIYSDLKEASIKKKRGPLSEEHKRKIAEALKKNSVPENENQEVKKANEEADELGYQQPTDKENYKPKNGEDIVIQSPKSQMDSSITIKTKDYTDVPALDVVIPKIKNILDKPKPYFIPDINQDQFRRKKHTLSAVKLDEDKYLVALDGFMGGVGAYSFSPAGVNKHGNFAIMSLDTFAATEKYYQLKAKAAHDKEQIAKVAKSKESIMEYLLKKRNLSEAEAKEEIKRYRFSKKRLSVLSKNKMTYDQIHMIHGLHQDNERRPPSRSETWDIYNDLMKDKTQKSIDIDLQQEYLETAYTKGKQTSYGDSGTKNDLMDEYGVKVKRQNGDEINKSEIKQIKDALDVTGNLFGKNKEMNKEYGLKISHSGKVLMHAAKAVGIFHPFYNAIGVSEKYGDKGFQFTFGHEYGHFMDNRIGKKSGNNFASDKEGSTASNIAKTFRKNMNKIQKSNYTNRTCECFARAIEQYTATETYGKDAGEFGQSYKDMGNHVNTEVYENQIKPLIEQWIRENKEFLKSLGAFDYLHKDLLGDITIPESKQGKIEFDVDIEKSEDAKALKAKNPGSNWKTIRGAHVLLGSGGKIIAGAEGKIVDKKGKKNKTKDNKLDSTVDKKSKEPKEPKKPEINTPKEIESEINRLRSIDTYDLDEIDKISDKIDELRDKFKDAKKKEAQNRRDKFKEKRKGFVSNADVEDKELRSIYKKESKEIEKYLSENKDQGGAVDYYVGEGYSDIREYLSDGSGSKKESKDIDQKIDNLSKFISNNKIKENLSLNRRVKGDGAKFFKSLGVGDVYEDSSFSSTSLKEIGIFGDFNIEILAKKGSNVANADNSGEFEYLIDKGAQFKVIDKDDKGIIVELI